jgi:hypothetical protein
MQRRARRLRPTMRFQTQHHARYRRKQIQHRGQHQISTRSGTTGTDRKTGRSLGSGAIPAQRSPSPEHPKDHNDRVTPPQPPLLLRAVLSGRALQRLTRCPGAEGHRRRGGSCRACQWPAAQHRFIFSGGNFPFSDLPVGNYSSAFPGPRCRNEPGPSPRSGRPPAQRRSRLPAWPRAAPARRRLTSMRGSLRGCPARRRPQIPDGGQARVLVPAHPRHVQIGRMGAPVGRARQHGACARPVRGRCADPPGAQAGRLAIPAAGQRR